MGDMMGYLLIGGWLFGVLLALVGLAVGLLSGPAFRALGRALQGKNEPSKEHPGLAVWLLIWPARAFGVICFAAGAFLLYTFCPHVGRTWDTAEARFDSLPDDTALRDIVVSGVKPMTEGGKIAGLAVGVIEGDKQAVYGFGRKSAGDAAPPDGDTVYEIGSITKVFTSLLLASLVDEGKLRLDEPLQEVLGKAVTVPTFEGTPICLIDLSTHSAGLPRMADDFATPLAIWAALTPGNPYAYYPAERLRTSLATCRLVSKPGTCYEYSNFGASVLGNALNEVAGLSYDELVRMRIAEPLGLKDTGVNLTPEQSRRRVPGYATVFDAGVRLSYPASNWDFPPGTEGVGGLKSTVNDMLRFLAANINPPENAIGHALKEAQVARRDAGMPDMRIGLGWHILQEQDAQEAFVWHNGGTRGYTSFLGFCPQRKTAVVLLSNSFDTIGDLDVAGFTILKALGQSQQ